MQSPVTPNQSVIGKPSIFSIATASLTKVGARLRCANAPLVRPVWRLDTERAIDFIKKVV